MGRNEALIAKTRELLNIDRQMVFYDPAAHDIRSGAGLATAPCTTLKAHLKTTRETRSKVATHFSSTTPMKLAFALVAALGVAGAAPAYRAGVDAWTSYRNVQVAQQNFEETRISFQPLVKAPCLNHIYASSIRQHGTTHQPNQLDQILSKGISVPALTVNGAPLIQDFQTCVLHQSTTMANQYISGQKRQTLENAAVGILETIALTAVAGGLWSAFSRKRKKETAREILDLTENAVRLALEENAKHMRHG